MIRRSWRWLAAGLVLGTAAKFCFGFVAAPLLFATPVLTTSTGVALSTWAAIAGGVGALLYSVGLQDPSGNEFLGVRINPNAPQKTPAGWTTGTGGADPTPPPTAGSPTLSYHSTTYGGANYPTAQEMADATCTAAGRGTGTIDSATGYHCSANSCGAGFLNCLTYAAISTCPTGYTNSSGTCTLQTPSAVRFPTDSRCGLTLSGGVMTYDSRDPDCDGTAPTQIVKSADGKTVTATNASSNGKVVIQVNADGSVQISSWAPSTNGSGTTTVNTAKIAAPGSATPTQLQSVAQATVNAIGTDALNVTPTAGQQSFPDDYSREGTQQAVLSKLGEVKTAVTDLTKSATAPSDPASVTEDFTGVFFPDTFTALRSWQMPARSVACPTWSFSVFSQSYTINAQCTLIEQQRATFSSIMLLVWALAALFIVLGA